MKKTTFSLVLFSVFMSFPVAVFASQDFDYYFGRFLVSSSNNDTMISASSQNQNASQIASMQASLNQIKTTLASLNLGLNKPAQNTNSVLTSKKAEEVLETKKVAVGIPLLLPENKKEEKTTLSVFASLIPPDVRNFPLLSTYLVILTLALFGVIIYLYFTRRQARKFI